MEFRVEFATYRSEIDEAVFQRYLIGYIPLRWLSHFHQKRIGKDLGGRRAGEEEERNHREW